MNLNAQISALETKLKQRDARILKLTRDLKAARRYIHELTRSTHVSVDDDDDDMELDEEEYEEDSVNADDDDNEEGEEEIVSSDEEEEEQNATLPQVLILDEVYACCSCGTEVLDGVCHNYYCGMEHQWPPNDPLYAEYSINTDSLAIHPDRSLVPRGSTPVLDIVGSGLAPDEYRDKPRALREPHRPDRSGEYWDLIALGATRLMCETFHLEYTYAGGIYAWADSDIFAEFSGPLMKQGHTWKIHLGRRIELEEGDADGSRFIEDLLEDAVLFPANIVGYNTVGHGWETKQETPGVWVTRPKADVDEEQDGDEAELRDFEPNSFTWDDRSGSGHHTARDRALEQPLAGGAIALDEYLSDSVADEDECGQPADAMSEDDDDYASPNSYNSDSDDVEVYDTALLSLTGPDRVWNSDMEDTSEDEVSQAPDGRGTP